MDTGKTSLLRDVALVDAGPLERPRTWLEKVVYTRPLGDATHVDGWIAAANRECRGHNPGSTEVAERTDTPGIATGLAVTGIGGDVLFIEAAHMDGDEGLTLTGQLGDVMKESVRIALSYVRSHAAELSIDPAAFKNQHFHVHVLAGAVPKHGPSAGVTMVTALASLLTGRPVRGGLGMTGEVTLQGKVLPIGGVKQKLLAAHRAGLTDVIVPRRNEPDLDDVPESVRAEIHIHPVSTVAEVLSLALSLDVASGERLLQAA